MVWRSGVAIAVLAAVACGGKTGGAAGTRDAAGGDPCADCANLTAVSSRVIRSGYYLVGASQLLASYRNYYPPANVLDFGFRCARTP